MNTHLGIRTKFDFWANLNVIPQNVALDLISGVIVSCNISIS